MRKPCWSPKASRSHHANKSERIIIINDTRHTTSHERLTPLASLDDWQLEHSRQDIRGWPIRDRQGVAIGTVDDMLVDREHERVAAVTLSDGSTVPVERLSICDHHVELKSEGAIGGRERTGIEGGDREERIPIVEEEIKIGKRKVETGGVRVTSHVVEAPVHEQVRLREEHVEVERRPVEGAGVKGKEASALLRDRDVEMRETSEEAVVAKEAMVTEELVVRKEASERVETIDDTVRRTEVDVDKLPGSERR